MQESPGGIYLSENARTRYGEMQELIHLSLEASGYDDEVPEKAYDDLREACSAFRTAITEDLDTRRKGSVWWTVMLRRRHRAQALEAKERKKRAVARMAGDDPPSESPR